MSVYIHDPPLIWKTNVVIETENESPSNSESINRSVTKNIRFDTFFYSRRDSFFFSIKISSERICRIWWSCGNCPSSLWINMMNEKLKYISFHHFMYLRSSHICLNGFWMFLVRIHMSKIINHIPWYDILWKSFTKTILIYQVFDHIFYIWYFFDVHLIL